VKVTIIVACAAFALGMLTGRQSVASNRIAASANPPTISVSEIMKNVGELPVQSYPAI
jgi:hypothetical protein